MLDIYLISIVSIFMRFFATFVTLLIYTTSLAYEYLLNDDESLYTHCVCACTQTTYLVFTQWYSHIVQLISLLIQRQACSDFYNEIQCTYFAYGQEYKEQLSVKHCTSFFTKMREGREEKDVYGICFKRVYSICVQMVS